MKNKWSKHWQSSKQPRKQRKFRYNAPQHLRTKFLGVHLSKELRTKHKVRALPVRKGDTVMILRGSNKKKTGKVEKVNRMNLKVYLENLKITKRDGTEVFVPLSPSNLMITSLNLEDKKRIGKQVAKPVKKEKVQEEKLAKKTIKAKETIKKSE